MIADRRRLAVALRPLVFQLYFLVRRETPRHQLTLAQGAVLAELATAGPCRMSQLAEAAGVRLPSMTDVIGRMERLGLVGRRPDPDDRRAVVVDLTEHGQRLHAELVSAREEFLAERLGGLSAADRAAIEAAIPALWRLLGRPGAAAATSGAVLEAESAEERVS